MPPRGPRGPRPSPTLNTTALLRARLPRAVRVAGSPDARIGLLADPRTLVGMHEWRAISRLTRALEDHARAMRGPVSPLARPAAASAPKRGQPGKLSEAILQEHLARHPIDKRRADGSRFSDAERVRALEREHGVRISRTTLVKRLGRLRRTPP
jgi:hypothetical protein